MPLKRPISAIRYFLATEAAGGYVLIGAAALAMITANSSASAAYFHTLDLEIAGRSLLHWINDGLMAVFFLLVGLEIKRELITGEMASWPSRVLPGAAALGGMIVPALVYLAVNAPYPENRDGWAIPAATDIAFALGVLALLGSRVPASLKLLLTAIAIIDDLGAIVIIAMAYTSHLAFGDLALACAGVAVLAGLNRFGVRSLVPYLLVGTFVWYEVLLSGVHATLAGVAVALTIPLDATLDGIEDDNASLLRADHRQAGRRFRCHFCAGAQRRRYPARRHRLAPDLRHVGSMRDRFHHEPVHRRARLWRRHIAGRRRQGRHPRGNDSRGNGRLPVAGASRSVGAGLSLQGLPPQPPEALHQ